MELNRKNYFSREAESIYLGSSSLKGWRDCEAKQLAKFKGEYQEPENSNFLLGNYVHSWSSGDLQEFMAENPSLFKKDGTLYAKYEIGDKMIETLKSDPLIEKYRQGEKEKIFTGEIAGAKFKIMIDVLNIQKGYFADIKTTRDIRGKNWIERLGRKGSFVEAYDYELQFAIYAEILRQNIGGDWLDSYILAVSKDEIPDKEIIYMGTEFIEEKLEDVSLLVPRIMEVKNGSEPISCGNCEYCRSVRKITKPIHYKNI